MTRRRPSLWRGSSAGAAGAPFPGGPAGGGVWRGASEGEGASFCLRGRCAARLRARAGARLGDTSALRSAGAGGGCAPSFKGLPGPAAPPAPAAGGGVGIGFPGPLPPLLPPQDDGPAPLLPKWLRAPQSPRDTLEVSHLPQRSMFQPPLRSALKSVSATPRRSAVSYSSKKSFTRPPKKKKLRGGGGAPGHPFHTRLQLANKAGVSPLLKSGLPPPRNPSFPRGPHGFCLPPSSPLGAREETLEGPRCLTVGRGPVLSLLGVGWCLAGGFPLILEWSP